MTNIIISDTLYNALNDLVLGEYLYVTDLLSTEELLALHKRNLDEMKRILDESEKRWDESTRPLLDKVAKDKVEGDALLERARKLIGRA